MPEYKIPLTSSNLGYAELKAVSRVIRSNWLTQGPVTEEFERRFADYIGTKYALAVSSGTTALHLALLSLNIGRGDEVICPSLSFVASANAICYVGAKPIFADIVSENNFDISADSIEKRITPKTKAIMVVHYGGYPCDMDAISKLAKRHNLKIIEDAAHAHGAVYKGRRCGGLGDIACFSFFSTKNMVTGEGGMVLTNDAAIAEKVRLLRSHGMTTQTLDRYRGHAHTYDVIMLGYNYRINEIASALGIVQ
jgi:dTDP-4-amino-4,6-dideoxygalactose transaminase